MVFARLLADYPSILFANSFAKLFRSSKPLTTACAQPELIERISGALSRRSKAMAKLNLLRLIKVICEGCGRNNGAIVEPELHRAVDLLSRQDDAVLVRQVSCSFVAGASFFTDCNFVFSSLERSYRCWLDQCVVRSARRVSMTGAVIGWFHLSLHQDWTPLNVLAGPMSIRMCKAIPISRENLAEIPDTIDSAIARPRLRGRR